MDGLIGLGWYALLIAMSRNLRVSLVLPIFYSEYNIMKMLISILGNSESPVWIHFNIWMFLEGLLFLAELPDFYIYFKNTSSSLIWTSIIFIAILSIGSCILTSFIVWINQMICSRLHLKSTMWVLQ